MKCEHCDNPVEGKYCHGCNKSATKQLISKRKKWGIFLIVAPYVGLIVILTAYAIASFVMGAIGEATTSALPFVETAHAQVELSVDAEYPIDDSTIEATIGNLIQVILGFFGVLCVLGILIGTPLGIYLIVTDKPKLTADGKAVAYEAKGFRPLLGIGQWLAAFLGVSMIVALVSIVVEVQRLGLLSRLIDGEIISNTVIEQSDTQLAVYSMLLTLCIVLTAIVYFVWLHRATRNVHVLGHKDMPYTPGWAIGWHFIPFANIVMPAAVLGTILKRSAIHPTHFLAPLWWFAWIISGLASNFVNPNPETFVEIRGVTIAYIVSDVMLIAAGIVLTLMIRQIVLGQEAQAKKHVG